MGLLRLLLAICVLCAHSFPLGNLPWLSGDTAVELFFVVSGFYMQLILSTKYTESRLGPSWRRKFYQARYFRLLPMYLVAAVLMLSLSVAGEHVSALAGKSVQPIPTWGQIAGIPNTAGNIAFKVYLCLTNVGIFFQDAVMFFGVSGGRIHFLGSGTEFHLYNGLIVPQAWSLGVELSFYLLAPALLKLRSRWLLLLAIAIFTVKGAALYGLHLQDPWTYRFFPFELSYFLLGSLAYRHREVLGGFARNGPAKWVTYGFAAILATGGWLPPIASTAYPLILAVALPYLFRATQHSRWDRTIGELSYPFYMLHLFALKVASGLEQHYLHVSPGPQMVWAALALTLALSAVALAIENRFIEPWRARFSIPRNQVSAPVAPASAAVGAGR